MPLTQTVMLLILPESGKRRHGGGGVAMGLASGGQPCPV